MDVVNSARTSGGNSHHSEDNTGDNHRHRHRQHGDNHQHHHKHRHHHSKKQRPHIRTVDIDNYFFHTNNDNNSNSSISGVPTSPTMFSFSVQPPQDKELSSLASPVSPSNLTGGSLDLFSLHDLLMPDDESNPITDNNPPKVVEAISPSTSRRSPKRSPKLGRSSRGKGPKDPKEDLLNMVEKHLNACELNYEQVRAFDLTWIASTNIT